MAGVSLNPAARPTSEPDTHDRDEYTAYNAARVRNTPTCEQSIPTRIGSNQTPTAVHNIAVRWLPRPIIRRLNHTTPYNAAMIASCQAQAATQKFSQRSG